MVTVSQTATRAPLLGLTAAELHALGPLSGEPLYRARQVAEWLYRRGARDLDGMTSLPRSLRQRLAESCEVGRSRVVVTRRSDDGTVKLLLSTRDSQSIETVGLPYDGRFSCCVSTQVGCPVRCAFCATGVSGYTRNLTAGEIVDQVLTVQETATARVSHVVFMGMGEPLLNYGATVKAVRLLNEELGIGMRHITVSTVGHVAGIRKLAEQRLPITLAISLHAPNDGLRRVLIPTMARWTVADIIAAARDYVATTGRRVTFEYCLLSGVNDGVAEARELGRLLQGLQCHVNLIPHNPVSSLPFEAPKPQHVKAFREALEEAGIQVTQRVQRGADIDAACGQLRRSSELLSRPRHALSPPPRPRRQRSPR